MNKTFVLMQITRIFKKGKKVLYLASFESESFCNSVLNGLLNSLLLACFVFKLRVFLSSHKFCASVGNNICYTVMP